VKINASTAQHIYNFSLASSYFFSSSWPEASTYCEMTSRNRPHECDGMAMAARKFDLT